MIAVIDYGVSNLRSVEKAFEKTGADVVVTGNARSLARADKLVLPGVGAFIPAMRALKDRGLDTAIRRESESGKPLLGICLGMQLLLDRSFEGGECEGLGLISGTVKKFDISLKVPHIGWNGVCVRSGGFLPAGDCEAYFVHSYYCDVADKYVYAETEYEKMFASAIRRENVYGFQFHPEKSGDAGLEMLKRFAFSGKNEVLK